jgi:hypothetical protein
MQQTGWRSLIAIVAAAWFLVAAMNLWVAADPVAQALLDLGRMFLIGAAILSLRLVDPAWAREQVRRLGRALNQPTT